MGGSSQYLKSHCLSQRMAPKDPVTAPAFPSAEVPSAPVKDGVKDVANPPIIAKDAPKELVKDASKEGIDVKKSKTDSKKKVSSTVKVDVVDPAIEVKEAKVVTAEAMVEPSGVKEMTKPSILKPSAAKEMPTIPSAFKVEMPTPSTAKPSAAKEMPIIPSAAKVEIPTPSMAKPSAAKEMTMVQSAAKVEVKVPDTPPVVSSLTKPSEISAYSVQPHVEEDEVVVLMETVSKKFGEMTFSDYNSAEDVDYCLSEAAADDTEDSLEWASETERTRAEDDLAEDKVGINYIGAALDIATEQAASFRIVQAGLVIGDWVLGAVESISPSEVMPLLSSVRRSARKIRRAGERETGPFRPLGMVSESTMKMATTFLATPLGE